MPPPSVPRSQWSSVSICLTVCLSVCVSLFLFCPAVTLWGWQDVKFQLQTNSLSLSVCRSLSLSLYLFPLIVLAQNQLTKENKTKEQHICWHSASSLCTTDGAFNKIPKSKNGPQNSSIHFQPKRSAQNPEIKQHVCCPVGTAKAATKLYYYPFIYCQNNIWLIGLTSHWVCVVDVGTVDTDDRTQIRQLRPCVVLANGHQSVGADLKVGSDGYKSRSLEARDRDRDRQTVGQRQKQRELRIHYNNRVLSVWSWTLYRHGVHLPSSDELEHALHAKVHGPVHPAVLTDQHL